MPALDLTPQRAELAAVGSARKEACEQLAIGQTAIVVCNESEQLRHLDPLVMWQREESIRESPGRVHWGSLR